MPHFTTPVPSYKVPSTSKQYPPYASPTSQTQYPGQSLYPTFSPQQKTSYPKIPTAPLHFTCPIGHVAYVYNYQKNLEFKLRSVANQDTFSALEGSNDSFKTNQTTLILKRTNKEYFILISLSFKVKNVNEVNLVYVDKRRKVIDRKKVAFFV